jgi:RNA polymerase sigma factor (sigma-70 family)
MIMAAYFWFNPAYFRPRYYGNYMHDSEVVAAIVAGDPAGLAEAYDRYAAPLYSFCKTMLREPADAADVVQDTFVIAAPRLSGLRDPERLRSWLYAVARNECRRRLRSGRQLAPIEDAQDATDETVDVAADAEKAELRALVRDALTGLGPAEREVLELQLRQGLRNGEMASVLGVSRNHAHALLSRARGQLETALGVLIVARSGRQDCPVLDRLLKDWDNRLTVLLRKRVNRHVGRCEVCSGRRRREMTPAMFLGAAPIAGLSLAALPAGLRDQVLRAATGNSPTAAAHRAATAARTTYPFGHHGFPRPLDPPRTRWPRPRPVHAGALAGTAGVALALGVVIVAAPPRHGAHPALGTTAGVTGGAGPAASWTAARRADSKAKAGATAAGHRSTTSATPAPASTPTPSSASTPTPATSSPSPSPSAIASTAPVTGTLSVSPATLDVAPPAAGTITLTASGGPVDWSVSEPPGLTKKVIVSPMSGTLAAGATGTVSVTVDGPGKMHVHLVFSPGGTTVTVVIS